MAPKMIRFKTYAEITITMYGLVVSLSEDQIQNLKGVAVLEVERSMNEMGKVAGLSVGDDLGCQVDVYCRVHITGEK